MACSWDGLLWTLGCESGHDFYLQAIGTWATDYRPTKARITFTGGDADQCRLSISSEDVRLAYGDPYSSEEEIDLDFTDEDAGDILHIKMEKVGGNAHPYPQFEISDIEFYE